MSMFINSCNHIKILALPEMIIRWKMSGLKQGISLLSACHLLLYKLNFRQNIGICLQPMHIPRCMSNLAQAQDLGKSCINGPIMFITSKQTVLGGVARPFPCQWAAHPEVQNEEENKKSEGTSRKFLILPTWGNESGYTWGLLGSVVPLLMLQGQLCHGTLRIYFFVWNLFYSITYVSNSLCNFFFLILKFECIY